MSRAVVLSSLVAIGLATILAAPQAAQRPRPPGATFKGDAFTLREIYSGIYHAVGSGAFSVGCNAAVIVNQHDVLIVDSTARRPPPGRSSSRCGRSRQAGEVRDQHALPLGSRARQPDLRARGRDHRLRVHAAHARRGRLDERPLLRDVHHPGHPGAARRAGKQLAAAPAGPERQKLEDRIAAQRATARPPPA